MSSARCFHQAETSRGQLVTRHGNQSTAANWPCCHDSTWQAGHKYTLPSDTEHTDFWQRAGAGNTFICHCCIHQNPKRYAPQTPPLHCSVVPLCVLLLKLQVPTPPATTSVEIAFPFVREPSALCCLLSCSKARNSRAMYRFLPASQFFCFSSPEIRATWS